MNSLRVNNLVRNPMLRKAAGLVRQMLVLPLLIAVASAITAPATIAQDSDVVRSVREIHLLPEERLKDRVAVDLECVVAYYAPDWPIAFLHDGTTGIYAGGPKDLNVKTGDHIRVRGVVGPIVTSSITPLSLPTTKYRFLHQLHPASDDCRTGMKIVSSYKSADSWSASKRTRIMSLWR